MAEGGQAVSTLEIVLLTGPAVLAAVVLPVSSWVSARAEQRLAEGIVSELRKAGRP